VIGTTLTFGVEVFFEYQWETLMLGLASHLLVGVLSFLASLTYLRKSRWNRSRPIVVIATYLVLGLSRGLLIAAVADFSEIPVEPDYLGRSVSGIWIYLFWAVLLTLLFETSSRYQDSKGLLDFRVSQLKSLKNFRLEAVERLRRDYLRQVEQTLAPALEQVRNAFDLEEIANTAIRPRSFDALELRVQQSQELQSKAESLNIAASIKAATTLSYSSSGVAALSVMALAFPFVYQGGFVGAVQLAITFLAITFALWLFQRIRNRPIAISAFVLTLAGLSITSASYFESSIDQGSLSMGSLVVGNWFIAVLLMFLSALDRQRDELASQLQAAVAELDSLEAKLRQELWLEQRQLDQLVHSEVQGRLRAAAVLAKTTGLDSDVEQLRRECISALTQGNRPQSLAEFQEELEVLWGQSLKLSFKIGPAAKASLEGDPYLSNAVFLVVREGVINAVKHGKAKRVGISISMKGNQLLTVQVRNDGAHAFGDRRGLGTELFDELSQSWTLEQSTADTVLAVNFPVLVGT
jgi:signal transduction histidine kinase